MLYFTAPDFKVKGDKFSYAEAAANVVKPITPKEIARHRGCRQFSTITIETYSTEGTWSGHEMLQFKIPYFLQKWHPL